jgi:hypothetical protein
MAVLCCSLAFYLPAEGPPRLWKPEELIERLHTAHTHTLSRSSVRHGLIPQEAITGELPKVRLQTVTTPRTFCVWTEKFGRQLPFRPVTSESRWAHKSKRRASKPAPIFFAHEFHISKAAPSLSRRDCKRPLTDVACARAVQDPKEDREAYKRGLSAKKVPLKIVRHNFKAYPFVKKNPDRLPRGEATQATVFAVTWPYVTLTLLVFTQASQGMRMGGSSPREQCVRAVQDVPAMVRVTSCAALGS